MNMKGFVIGVFYVAVYLCLRALAYGQTPLPHNIPDLCAGDPAKTVVAPLSSTVLTGVHSCIEVRGQATVKGQLKAVTILVYPGGALTFDSGSETIFTDAPINTTVDPERWGHGLIAVGGTVRGTGVPKTAFARSSADISAGATILTLRAPLTGATMGDRLFVPDTRHLSSSQHVATIGLQHEICTVAAISADLQTVTCASPLQFAHRGGRNADGTPAFSPKGEPLLPHVANLTRSIVVRSENPNGVRGHVLFTGRTDVRLFNIAWVNLGRTKPTPLDSTLFDVSGNVTHLGTNQIGRYPPHFHFLEGPDNPTNTGYQAEFVGNVIEGAEKWLAAIHATSWMRFVGNVLVFGQGAGLALEDGSETENLIDGNFFGAITGKVDSRTSGNDAGVRGTAGECLWAMSFDNYITNNVATGCKNASGQLQPASGVGFKFFRLANSPTAEIPKFRGARMHLATERLTVQPQAFPIRQFDRNEAYGLIGCGWTAWHLQTNGDTTPAVIGTVLRDFIVWNAWECAIWPYPVNRLTIENLTYRVDPSVNTPFMGHAIIANDYRVASLTMRGGSVHGRSVLWWAQDPVGSWLFQNVTAVTRDCAYRLRTPATPGTSIRRTSGVDLAIDGGKVSAWPGLPLCVAAMIHDTSFQRTDTLNPYQVSFTNYQGTGASFRAYFPQQASAVLYGEQAPSTANGTAHPEIAGLTSSTIVPPPPPPVNRAPTVSTACLACTGNVGQSARVQATGTDADGDPLTYQWTSPTGSFSAPTSPTTDFSGLMGPHVLTVTVNDGKGGLASAIVTVSFVTPPDAEDPVIAITSPPAGVSVIVGASLPVAATASDNVGVTAGTFQGAAISYPHVATFTPTTVGTHSLTWTAQDAAGNTTIQSVSVTATAAPSPCVSRPLVVTITRWPTSQSASTSGTWNPRPFTLVKAGFEWLPSLRFVAVDDRGCVFHRVK